MHFKAFWSLTPALRAVLPQVVDKSAAARWRAGTGHSLRDIWSLRHGLVAPARHGERERSQLLLKLGVIVTVLTVALPVWMSSFGPPILAVRV